MSIYSCLCEIDFKMDWKIQIKNKSKIIKKNHNEIEYCQRINWPKLMELDVNYNLTCIKSHIEYYNENKLFEYLDVINVTSLKNIINSYLLIRYINFNIISYKDDFDKYYGSYNSVVIINYNNKIYKIKYNFMHHIISFHIYSNTAQMHIDKPLTYWNNYICSDSFNKWFDPFIDKITDINESQVLWDVLYLFREIIKRL